MKNKVEGNTLAPIGAMKQSRRNETGFNHNTVGADITQSPINSGAFGHSGMKNVEKKIGLFETKPNKNSHTMNKGWDTLSSDSRNDPLAGTDKSYGMLDANAKNNVRITEAGDRNVKGKKHDKLGNVLSS